MSLPDLSHFDADQLRTILSHASTQLEQLAKDKERAESTRKQDITASITSLAALLGPDDAAPGLGSIRAVAAYDDDTIVEHSGLAFRLILQGLEILTSTTLDLARVVGQD